MKHKIEKGGWVLTIVMMFAGTVGGCGLLQPAGITTPTNVQVTAQTPEQVAFALYASYTVVAEQALKIAQNPTTPPNISKTLTSLHLAASPTVHQMREAAIAYQQAKEALGAGTTGTTTTDQITSLLNTLNQLIAEAAPKINATSAAVTQNQPATPGATP